MKASHDNSHYHVMPTQAIRHVFHPTPLDEPYMNNIGTHVWMIDLKYPYECVSLRGRDYSLKWRPHYYRPNFNSMRNYNVGFNVRNAGFPYGKKYLIINCLRWSIFGARLIIR